MVAELNFGFWKFLLARPYEATLWTPALWHAFPNRHDGRLPPGRLDRRGRPPLGAVPVPSTPHPQRETDIAVRGVWSRRRQRRATTLAAWASTLSRTIRTSQMRRHGGIGSIAVPPRAYRMTIRLGPDERDTIVAAARDCDLTAAGYTAKAALAAAISAVTPAATPVEMLRELLRELFTIRRAMNLEMQRLIDLAATLSDAQVADSGTSGPAEGDELTGRELQAPDAPADLVAAWLDAVRVWRDAAGHLDAVVAEISRRLR